MRVGTREVEQCKKYGCEDHPHACGDKLSEQDEKITKIGSSPCVWGQGRKNRRNHNRRRIIPMRVGTSPKRCGRTLKRQDHPHACGDKFFQFADATAGAGSSPCVWGQVNVTLLSSTGLRIIPMRVGTRNQPCFLFDFVKDHPHACGDKRACRLP